jgi:hypothetical protein
MAAAPGASDHTNEFLADQKGADCPGAFTGLNLQRAATRFTVVIRVLNVVAAKAANGGEESVTVWTHLSAGRELKFTHWTAKELPDTTGRAKVIIVLQLVTAYAAKRLAAFSTEPILNIQFSSATWTSASERLVARNRV